MTESRNDYYIYCFLRENKDEVGERHTPYYIGMSRTLERPFAASRAVKPPKDNSLVRILEDGLTHEAACFAEAKYIFMWGRIDTGTGILVNKTNGGAGVPGIVRSVSGSPYERKRKGRQLAIELPPELLQRLKAHAAASDRPVSALVRRWIEAGLNGGLEAGTTALAQRIDALEAAIKTYKQKVYL